MISSDMMAVMMVVLTANIFSDNVVSNLSALRPGAYKSTFEPGSHMRREIAPTVGVFSFRASLGDGPT